MHAVASYEYPSRPKPKDLANRFVCAPAPDARPLILSVDDDEAQFRKAMIPVGSWVYGLGVSGLRA